MKFLKEYVLNKERLLKVLPIQMKHFTEDELNQRYSSYFAKKINGLKDVLKIAGIKEGDLKIKCLSENQIEIKNLDKKITTNFPKKVSNKNAIKLLLVNISTHFTKDKDVSEYDVLEPPLGLIALQTYLNKSLGEKIHGKIIKSRVDFDNYDELGKIIEQFKPDVVGVSSMTFHKDFFHEAISQIRNRGFDKTLVVGGPHPTTSYKEVLKDENIDICVIGEGEVTLEEILRKLINNNGSKLLPQQLDKIDGIAYNHDKFKNTLVLKKESLGINSNARII